MFKRFWAIAFGTLCLFSFAAGAALAQAVDAKSLFKPLAFADIDRAVVAYVYETPPAGGATPRWFIHATFCVDPDDTKVTGLTRQCKEGKAPVNLTAAERTALTARLKQAALAAGFDSAD